MLSRMNMLQFLKRQLPGFPALLATLALLGGNTSHTERTHLTIRLFSGRLTRKT